jgi:hypothetical protein
MINVPKMRKRRLIGEKPVLNNTRVRTEDEEDDYEWTYNSAKVILFSLVMALGWTVSLVAVILAGVDYATQRGISNELTALSVQDMQLNNNITLLENQMDYLFAQTVIMEAEIVVLQQNITDLGIRIANITCHGIENINGVNSIATNGSFFILGDGGTAVNVTNIPDQNAIVIDGSYLQNELNIQAGTLVLLENMVASTSANMNLLQQEALRFINGQPPLLNNIEFVGVCNASVYGQQNITTVFVDACALAQDIDNQFNIINAQFIIAFQQLAWLSGNLTFIEAQITAIENQITFVNQTALKTLNHRLPIANTLLVAPNDTYIIIQNGPLPNQINVTNNGIQRINNLTSQTLGNINLVGTDGYEVVVTDSETLTVNNLLAPVKCIIQSNQFNNAVSPALVNDGLGLYYNIDMNFTGVETLTPPGCAAQPVFKRFAVANPFSHVVNQVCKPAGKWILSVLVLVTYTAGGGSCGSEQLSLQIGLGTAGSADDPVYNFNSLASTTACGIPNNRASLVGQFTITNTTAACYDVVYFTFALIISPVAVSSSWQFIQIN